MSETVALSKLNEWGGQPLPISASSWCAGSLWLRLSGAPAALAAARDVLGGDEIDGGGLWTDVREQRHPFFAGDAPLWRISVPSTAGALGLAEEQFIEWGGALRWLRSSLPSTGIQARAGELGGHATLFRGGDRSQGVFTPVSPALAKIHRRLKAEFDPSGVFNPGRMYPEF
jgi:glycolate oxidase FAD binding subunit